LNAGKSSALGIILERGGYFKYERVRLTIAHGRDDPGKYPKHGPSKGEKQN
jgi:hypothetical protein